MTEVNNKLCRDLFINRWQVVSQQSGRDILASDVVLARFIMVPDFDCNRVVYC